MGGFESLLGTLEAFLPNHLLAWHYRSEDERLIAFSNAHIYDARLVTFPSARGAEALRHILVPHEPGLGGELESASPEVEEVVRQVLLHAETRPDESLGVITMGIQHKNRVQAALDAALALRPELSPFFAFEREERFFVKNLETVQGDERDTILLSIGYGKTAGGDLPHRFGPLTQEAGHRRLNVAVTRARSRMCVVSSFAAHEIDLERSGSEGVRLLKAYLEYAAGGGARAEEPAAPAAESPLEADVRAALEARGVAVRPRYGASRRRIDLVAMHPSKPGRPVLAIECDGASYVAHATARDRDRLRQSHLQRLGWRFHRIWSTDWFYGREQELLRVLAACAEAEQHADRLDAEGSPEAAPPAEAAAQPAAADRPPAAGRRGPRPSVPQRERIDLYSERELQALARWVVSDGLLRTDEELIRELFMELPFKRLGARIRMRLELLVQGLSPGAAPGRQA
jgi:very-short-patch-repair endonuclease